MNHPELGRALAADRVLDLQRAAERARRAKRARRPAPAAPDDVVVIREAAPVDASALARLAVLDESALAFPTVYVSAGRRGTDLELAPGDLMSMTGARVAQIAR